MVKNKFLFLLAFTLLFVSTHSTFSLSSPAFQFLTYNSSARASALAGCFVSMTGDENAVFYNPASIYTVNDKPFTATFFKHVLDINSGLASYSFRYKDLGKFAVSASYTNYGSFDYADNQGNRNGSTFSANDLSFGASYSNKIDTNLYYGATLNFIYETIDKFASSAIGFDVGLIYMIPEKRTNIGISILHAGMQLSKFQTTSDRLPLDIRLGVNNRLQGLPLLVNFSFHHLADQTDNFFQKFLNFSLGGELYVGNYIMVRLGFDNQIRRLVTPDNNKGFSGFSAGIGIKTKDINIDYSMGQLGIAALLHRFSLNLNI
jgi:hypothetical protein